jgi:hypothetical protein
MTCRHCGNVWTSYEEKETDVNIAVGLVADAAASASDIALIVSALACARVGRGWTGVTRVSVPDIP